MDGESVSMGGKKTSMCANKPVFFGTRRGTYRSSPALDLARLRKKSMTFLAAPELPG